MSLRSTLWISGILMAGVVVPASADNIEPNGISSPATYTRTYLFPPASFAPFEVIRIIVTNIAPASHNGTKASCNVTISFNDVNGNPIVIPKAAVPPNPTALPATFPDVGTGQIEHADLLNPGSLNKRVEVEGMVQVTLKGPSPAPCSPFISLEIFDSVSGGTRAVVTAVAEQPANMPIAAPGLGLGR